MNSSITSMVCIKPNDQANVSTTAVNKIVHRRSADYKPNIWNYDHLLSLATEFDEQQYTMQAHKMKEEVRKLFHDETIIDPLEKLELLDNIQKLGLATYFEKEIDEVIANFELLESRRSGLGIEDDIYATSLWFRMLRQYGCNASQDMLRSFVDKASRKSKKVNVKAMLGFYEATHLAIEGENILEEARVFAANYLEDVCNASLEGSSSQLAKEVVRALELPFNLSVEWFNVRNHICDYEKDDASNFSLLMLAKLNFNIVQATHQRDLKELLRWWKLLGTNECLSFTRNRVVESYLWATGVACEPQYANLRKWLTKVIKLVIIIDDVYDIFGTLEEVEIFTASVERWDSENTELLPESMRFCMKLLYATVDEITTEILEQKGYRVKQHIQNAWIEFCKGLLVEARWYHQHYTPTINEYLNNGWVTSCGPLLSIHVVYSVSHGAQEEANTFVKNKHDLVYNTSLIIRLCNDQGTTKAEIERGDAPTSIICYMREANVSEGVARKKISDMISDTWRKINSVCMSRSPSVKCITNMARVAHFIYLKGDGFGIQHRETRDHVLSLLVHPFPLY